MPRKPAIIIFGETFTFPGGTAATNRVHTYAKGFTEHGIKSIVICFRNDYMQTSRGSFDNIDYYYTFNQNQRSNSFIKRRWLKFIKYFRTIALIREIKKNYHLMAVGIWSNRLLPYFFIWSLRIFLKFSIFHEHSEHPLRECKSYIKKLYCEIHSFVGTQLSDGIICISQYLMDFYKKRFVNDNKLLLVPSTVDTTRFINNGDSPLVYDYILYCGSLTILKDGVHILIESFNSIADRHPDIHLVLIGKGDIHSEEIAIKELADKLVFKNRIHFLGPKPRNEVPVYLSHAKVLALARPRSIIADAGFPSKLTEYLCTGKPIVVTSVGEIPIYLKDNENAFIAEPDSSDSFSGKLDYVLNNYDLASEVGHRGRQLTETIFNYKFQAMRLIGFIMNLNANSDFKYTSEGLD